MPELQREQTDLRGETAPLKSEELKTELRHDPAYQAYKFLYVGFVLLPLIAGEDKFSNNFADWGQYLAPAIQNAIGISTDTFMRGVGAIEMIAAIGVLWKPRIFSYVVAAWLGGIIVNLLLRGDFYDIALRDFGLALAALAFARLASKYSKPKTVPQTKPVYH